MPVSEAKLKANQANSLRSTGPSEASKARTRLNALKHGLSAKVVATEAVEAVRERAAGYREVLKPDNALHEDLVEQLAVASLRLERCSAMERAHRDRRVIRAEMAWDDDRSEEAASLGSKLASRPDEVASRLRKTIQGCRWLMKHWTLLAEAAESGPGTWTPEQDRLALDLLGIPGELRDGRSPASDRDPAAFARAELARLEGRLAVLGKLDAVDRSIALADLDDDDAELRRLRRYENALHSQIRWCVEQVRGRAPRVRAAAPERAASTPKPLPPRPRPVEALPPRPTPAAAPVSARVALAPTSAAPAPASRPAQPVAEPNRGRPHRKLAAQERQLSRRERKLRRLMG